MSDTPPDPQAEAEAEATAFHEAGHAVVAVLLGRPVHRVSMVPKQETLGRVEFGKGLHRPSDDWVETEVLISLAGMAAEARRTGTYDRAAAGRDLRFARKLLAERGGERKADRLERRMLAKVESLLADDGAWAAVEAVAAELLKHGTISGRAAKHLVDRFAAE